MITRQRKKAFLLQLWNLIKFEISILEKKNIYIYIYHNHRHLHLDKIRFLRGQPKNREYVLLRLCEKEKKRKINRTRLQSSASVKQKFAFPLGNLVFFKKRLLSGKCEIAFDGNCAILTSEKKIIYIGKVTVSIETHLILFFFLTPAICVPSFILPFFPLNFLSLSGV